MNCIFTNRAGDVQLICSPGIRIRRMTRFILFSIVSLMVSPLLAQEWNRLSVAAAMGLGGAIYKQPNRNGARIMGALELSYRINENIFVSLEASSSGKFIVVGLYGGDEYDQASNTILRNPYNQNATTFVSKFKYQRAFHSINFFAGVAGGTNRYSYRWPVRDVEAVKKYNIALQADVGLVVKRFEFSLRYLLGGRTPSFVGIDNNGSNVILRSIRTDQLLLATAYRIPIRSPSEN